MIFETGTLSQRPRYNIVIEEKNLSGFLNHVEKNDSNYGIYNYNKGYIRVSVARVVE